MITIIHVFSTLPMSGAAEVRKFVFVKDDVFKLNKWDQETASEGTSYNMLEAYPEMANLQIKLHDIMLHFARYADKLTFTYSNGAIREYAALNQTDEERPF